MSLLVLSTPAGLVDVLGGELALPLRGNWVAHLETGQDAVGSSSSPPPPAPGTPVVLQVAQAAGPPVLFHGTVRRAGPWGGRSEIVLIGGAGGLLQQLPPANYLGIAKPVPALQVLQDIVSAAGETLDATVPPLLASLTVPRWTRAGGCDVTTAIGLLATKIGCGWRMLDSGKLWMGPELWTAVDASALSYQLDDDADELVIAAAPDSPTLRPGTTLTGQGFPVPRQITKVSYSVDASRLSAELRYTQEERADLLAALTTVLPPLVYREAHGATVDTQRDDGTLDLTPDDPRLGNGAGDGLLAVPFRCGVAGARLVVPRGARVRVAFEQGDPSLLFAFALDQDPAATLGVARVSDTCGRLIFDSAVSILYYAPSATAPYAAVAANPNSPAPPDPTSEGTPIVIATGSSSLFVRPG